MQRASRRPRAVLLVMGLLASPLALAQAPRVDPGGCAALAADTGRLAGKFALVRQGCDALAANDKVPERPREPLPRTRQAQQLYLYESGGSTPQESAAGAAPAPQHPASSPVPPRKAAPAMVQRALHLAAQVDAVARAHDIDPLLLHAIAHVESRHDAAAVSSAGARGVMQVMPATAQRFGVSQAHALHDSSTNLQVSAAYLKTLQLRFGNDLPLVLAAYNAGEGAVERHGRRIPPYAQTQGYVVSVLAQYQRLRSASAAGSVH